MIEKSGFSPGSAVTVSLLSENLKPVERFLMALRAPESKRQYPKRLESFFHFLRLQGNFEQMTSLFCQLVERHEEADWLTNQLLKFLHYQKTRVARKEIEEATISNYFKAIKLFCEMNNIIAINWKLLSRSMPKGRHSSNDRPPSRDEINKLIDYPDRRIRPIILVMISSGIRVGAWDDMKWKHVIPVEKDGTLVAAKLLVYPGENEEYFTFMTPQAYNSLVQWMVFANLKPREQSYTMTGVTVLSPCGVHEPIDILEIHHKLLSPF